MRYATLIRAALLAASACVITGTPALGAENCSKPTSQDIQVPDGQVATREDMLTAQRAVNAYIDEMNTFLACLEARGAELPEGAEGERARAINDARYSAARDELLRLAEQFNVQVRAYQVRQDRPD